ncbi:hypothetical protein AvCA_03780 [Azotobacter vinelandii CA]|uniref:NADH:flavin oxidoreductase/NADH oxidase N-terminal domain-containing protein n=2 Tax=Azotobacter vinelandii TaxID=354 RepID=C1DIE1_AZOVD|nr:hypothetical protein [Azotobacter vinelandii]ACO76638.1 hypothetical protein Avin_03780 [Azotobacter vinelandii DJ]AGK17326.1 hypothetical protein AvCA_03780 [Azotobacter vinelandii CA]AGK19256.1 hypothetical protein AvCA6_03780 [Azotobacter vinelandii CA6]WKN24636.1 hypothetical protein AVAEIV_000362 [Azotobacter vinelandii]SFX12713.1 N-ethylmaleimide reductase [Azotobacter vinelandii]
MHPSLFDPISLGEPDLPQRIVMAPPRRADAIAFGRPFIANPDLPERFRRRAPLDTPDSSTFFGGAAEGYIDYPSLIG